MRHASRTKALIRLAAIAPSLLILPMAAQAPQSTPDKTTIDKPRIDKPEDPIETTTVDLSNGKPLAGLPAAEVKDLPVRCSRTGTTFFDIYADSTSPVVADFPQLWSIDHLGDVKHLQRNLPHNYKGFYALSTFPSRQALVSLVQATGKVDPFNPRANKTLDYFIVLSNYDGTSPDPIKLDLSFSPTKIGALESGRFVIFGIDEANGVLGLAIVEADGTLHKTLDLDNKTYEKDGTLNRVFNSPKDPANKDETFAVMRASSFAEFLGDGANVVLFQNTTRLPAKVIGDEGEVSTFTLTPPSGFAILDVLASDPKGPIVARLQSETDLAKSMQEGGVQQPKEQLAEFSRETGTITKWIKVTGGPFPQEVSCATNGELTSIYWPKDDAKPATDTPATTTSDKPPNSQLPKVDQLLFAKAPF